MFTWLSLTQFPDHNETIFSINNHVVFSNKPTDINTQK